MLTNATVSAGAYSLLLPRNSTAIVLELVGDSDGNGSATSGEWFGVQDGQGNNVADQDRTGIDINVTLCAGGEAAAPAPAPTQTPPPAGTAPTQEAGPAGPPPSDPPPPPEASRRFRMRPPR